MWYIILGVFCLWVTGAFMVAGINHIFGGGFGVPRFSTVRTDYYNMRIGDRWYPAP